MDLGGPLGPEVIRPKLLARRGPAIAAVLLASWGLGQFFACSRGPESYYPLAEGWVWEYRVTPVSLLERQGAADVVVTNIGTRDLRGKKVTVQKVDSRVASHVLFVAEDGDGVFELATQAPGAVEPVLRTPPSYFLRYPIKPGTTWEGPGETTLLRQNVSLTLRSTVETVGEVVTVPAGTFERCVRVRSVGAAKAELRRLGGVADIDVEDYRWYAPGVGQVASLRKERSNSLIVGSGEMSMQLRSYKKDR